MNDKIEVGEYVRTIDGIIGKVTNKEIMPDNSVAAEITSGQNIFYYSSGIAKHSKNIIDLIEVGDFVNGH